MIALNLLPDTTYDNVIFNQDIDGRNFIFRFAFNYKLNHWVCTILDPEKKAIASNPVLNESLTFRLYSRDSGIFTGDVVLLDDLRIKEPCGRSGMNVTHTLTYYEA